MLASQYIAFLFGMGDRIVDHSLLLALMKKLVTVCILKYFLSVSLVVCIHNVRLS